YCSFFFSSRRRHTRSKRDWSSDVCSSDLIESDGDRKGDRGEDEHERTNRARPIRRHPVAREIAGHDIEHTCHRRSPGEPKNQNQIGRASCRERGEKWEVGGCIKKKIEI